MKNMLRSFLKRLGFPVLHIYTVVRHPLTSIAIEINSHCNRRCVYCPNHTYQREISFLDEGLYYKIIDELKEMHFKGGLTFNGFNEPLLDKRLVSFIEYARKCLPLSYIYLNTNGDFLDFPLWKKLRVAGLDHATVSQYEGKVNSNVQNLLSNLEEEEKKLIFVKIFDVSMVCNRAGSVEVEDKVKLPVKEFCVQPFYQLQINYKGKALLCCDDYLGSIEMGDIHYQKITDIWKSGKFQAYRRKLIFKDRASLDLCKKCNVRDNRYPPIRIPAYLQKISGFHLQQ